MHLRKLKPTEQPFDAVLLCAIFVGIVGLGYVLGLGWSGAAVPVVIIGSLLLGNVRKRGFRR